MAAEMRLYRVPIIGSNAERRHGKVVDEVTVKVGTKWLTDNRGCRYYKAPSEDANRNPYFQQNSMYWSTDYRLYQTEQAAKDNDSFVVCFNASHQTNNGEYRAYAEDEV